MKYWVIHKRDTPTTPMEWKDYLGKAQGPLAWMNSSNNFSALEAIRPSVTTSGQGRNAEKARTPLFLTTLH